MSENEIREYALMKATFKWLLIGMIGTVVLRNNQTKQ